MSAIGESGRPGPIQSMAQRLCSGALFRMWIQSYGVNEGGQL